jgi:hypothetical protein
MKKAVLGALVGAGLVAALGMLDRGGQALAQKNGVYQPSVPGTELVVLPMSAGDKAQLLTVIDPHQQVICVYHVETASGKIALRGVRNFHWDMQMTYLNNEAPLPQEIRSMLDQTNLR